MKLQEIKKTNETDKEHSLVLELKEIYRTQEDIETFLCSIDFFEFKY